MIARPAKPVNAQEYFVQDASSDEKLEYYAGVIVAQAGSTARHNLIVTNIIGHLYQQLRDKGCRIYSGDMRVQAVDQQVYTYPDLSIVCGAPHYMDTSEMTLLNPTIIIEILSPSMQTKDRKEKLVYYRSIAALQEYILIAQDAPYVQQYTRQTDHLWLVHLTDDLEASVNLESIGSTLPMQAIFADIRF